MTLPFRGRRVNAQVTSNTRDPVDAYVGAAYWLDTLGELSQTELDELGTECAGEIQEAWMLHVVEEAADRDWDMER